MLISRLTDASTPPSRPTRHRAALGALGALAAVSVAVLPVLTPPSAVAADDSTDELGASTFVAVAPCRLFDSRDRGTAVIADATTEVAVGGRCATPDQARAAAVTITVTDPAGAGFLTAWGGETRPASSNVNFAAGATVANSSIVPLDELARMRISTSVDAHVIVDVAGVFVAASESRAGRFVSLPPTRAADTRIDDGRPLLPGETRTVALPLGVPADATAISATVTLVNARRAGFVTAHPAGSPRPSTSISNLGIGQTHAASAILPVSPDGVSIHADSGGHVVLDVTGYFTGPSADTSADGLFVPIPPERLHDSRSPRRTLAGGGAREIPMPDSPSAAAPASASAAAWALDITGTDARRPGFVTVFPARTERPDTSVVNVTTGGAASNSAIVAITEHGLAVWSDTALHIVVDATGWFTGPPVVATTGPAPDPIAPARVLVVGDSAAAGMRWNNATTALRGAEFTIDLESCRRLVRVSCNGREGWRPPSALAVVERYPYGRFDVLVVATGYNDEHGHLGEAIDLIVPAAHARGMRTVVWLTYREDVGYQIPTGASTSYPLMNAELHDRAPAAGIDILDWWTYTADAPHWFADDGVHQTLAGSLGQGDAISRALAAIEQRTCPMPWRVGEAREQPCPAPGPLPAERDGVPDVGALYPEALPPTIDDGDGDGDSDDDGDGDTGS